MSKLYPISDDLKLDDSRQQYNSAFTLKNVRQIKDNHLVLDNINVVLAEGQITAVVGPSGAGKTSFLRLLNRLDDPVGGKIFYRLQPLDEYPVQNLRQRVGFVFQTPIMFPGTVHDNLLKALEIAGKPAFDYRQLIKNVIEISEVSSSLLTREGSRLSIGQKQRVNIARALMTEPEALLMDEPTSALDSETADRLMETVRRLGQEKHITIVLITHRLSEARKISDSTLVMESGRIIAVGTTEYIFEQTANSRLKEFLGSGK